MRKSFVPDHQLFSTGKVWLRSTFDASLVAHIRDLPLDSTHWVGIFRAAIQVHGAYQVETVGTKGELLRVSTWYQTLILTVLNDGAYDPGRKEPVYHCRQLRLTS